MKTITIDQDAHFHNLHEGLELTLVFVKAPKFLKRKSYFTSGLQLNEVVETGMFSKQEQPLQLLANIDDQWIFTMSNCTSLDRDDILELKETGKLIRNDPLYPVSIYLEIPE